jgi:hypothetical protein
VRSLVCRPAAAPCGVQIHPQRRCPSCLTCCMNHRVTARPLVPTPIYNPHLLAAPCIPARARGDPCLTSTPLAAAWPTGPRDTSYSAFCTNGGFCSTSFRLASALQRSQPPALRRRTRTWCGHAWRVGLLAPCTRDAIQGGCHARGMPRAWSLQPSPVGLLAQALQTGRHSTGVLHVPCPVGRHSHPPLQARAGARDAGSNATCSAARSCIGPLPPGPTPAAPHTFARPTAMRCSKRQPPAAAPALGHMVLSARGMREEGRAPPANMGHPHTHHDVQAD